jgi:hypothetical protein
MFFHYMAGMMQEGVASQAEATGRRAHVELRQERGSGVNGSQRLVHRGQRAAVFPRQHH